MKRNALLVTLFLVFPALALAAGIKQGDCTWAEKNAEKKFKAPLDDKCWYGTPNSEKIFVNRGVVYLIPLNQFNGENDANNFQGAAIGVAAIKGRNLFYGRGGKDLIVGTGKQDFIYGNSDDDLIVMRGKEFVMGRSGNNSFILCSSENQKKNILDLKKTDYVKFDPKNADCNDEDSEETQVKFNYTKNNMPQSECPCEMVTAYHDDGTSYLGSQYSYCPCDEDYSRANLELESAH